MGAKVEVVARIGAEPAQRRGPLGEFLAAHLAQESRCGPTMGTDQLGTGPS